MAAVYTIVSPQRTFEVEPGGRAEARFVVTNITTTSLPTQLRPKPMDDMPPRWLSLVGPTERGLDPEVPTDVLVSIDVPLGTAGGSRRFRLDAASALRPDVDYVQGLPVLLTVPGEPPERKPFPRILLAIPIALVLLAIVGGLAVFIATRPDPTVVVPDVRGQPSAAARQALESTCVETRCLTVSVTEEVVTSGQLGVVLRMDPLQGTEVAPDTEVRIFVSKGPDTVAVPNVAGRLEAAAIALLAQACEPRPCLQTASRPESSNAVPLGTAIRSDPVAGTIVARGTLVTVVVSDGPATVTVPDVAGRQQAAAFTLLEQACQPQPCLRPTSRQEASDTVPFDTAIRSEPAAGSTVARGTQVTVVLSSGPATVVLPDVSGSSVALARAELINLCQPTPCLDVRQRTVGSNLPDGFVLGTEPQAGTTVQRGSLVTIVVARCSQIICVPP
jgi:serine/threonine-protein kinase